MALSFPNKSRAFDATRRAVRFWGYDSAMEVAFFVTEDALFSQTCSPTRRGYCARSIRIVI